MAYPPPPYADAVCGTPLCGEAICGAWWAYPLAAPLGLGDYPVQIVIPVGEEVPIAGLSLGAWGPGLSHTLFAPATGLSLGAEDPALVIAAVLQVAAAALGLGGQIPHSAGVQILMPIPCIDLPLVADLEADLALAAAPATILVLDPARCN